MDGEDADVAQQPIAQLWLVIPVKPFAEAKSRLAQTLAPAERATLMQTLLLRVLKAAKTSALFAGILVVSRDDRVLALAETVDATTLREQGNGLNSALEEARRYLWGRAEALLVLPADLPEITAEGLQEFIAALNPASCESAVAIAPSLTGGTNALLLVPPNAIPFAFGVEAGVESSERHAQLAIEAGVRLVIVKSNTLEFDVDLPSDYRVFSEL